MNTPANTPLAIQTTKLANQRTYLAYMKAGFPIAVIAGSFKQKWVAIFGIIMILGSLIQYILLNHALDNNEDPNNAILDMFPIIFVIISLGALYLQTQTHNSISGLQVNGS